MPKQIWAHPPQPPPEAQPFLFEAGPVGCLLIHGYTGCAKEMIPMGRRLAERGITTSGILLKGHGTSPEDMARTGWRDWTDSAIDGWNDLNKRCEKVFVAGFSMGGALALYLGATQSDAAGVIALSGAAIIRDWRLPLVGLAKRFVKFFPKGNDNDLANPQAFFDMWSYNVHPLSCSLELVQLTAVVRDLLPHITAPILIMHGLRDRTLSPDSARYIHDHVGSADKQMHLLPRSGHGLVVDVEREEVFDKTVEFIRGVCG